MKKSTHLIGSAKQKPNWIQTSIYKDWCLHRQLLPYGGYLRLYRRLALGWRLFSDWPLPWTSTELPRRDTKCRSSEIYASERPNRNPPRLRALKRASAAGRKDFRCWPARIIKNEWYQSNCDVFWKLKLTPLCWPRRNSTQGGNSSLAFDVSCHPSRCFSSNAAPLP